MKAILSILFFQTIILTGYAQQIKYDMLASGIMPKRTGWKSYLSKDGMTYSVGDTIRIGKPSEGMFKYIGIGDDAVIKTNLPAHNAGEVVKITRIEIYGWKRTGYFIVLKVEGPIFNYVIQIENSINSGEIFVKQPLRT